MSAMIPPAFVMVEQPNIPAKKRSTNTAVRLGAPHTAAWKAVKGIRVMMYAGRRPQISDIGAQRKGPMTNPATCC